MKTWTFLDKAKWPVRGPWDREPDKAQWEDEATGLTCLAVRASAHWCGYVGVPENHPLFGKGYNDVDFDVHGGITFADACQEGEGEARICHTPESGQPDKVWWFGFDCAHAGDLRPVDTDAYHQVNLMFPHAEGYGIYRTLDYVREECKLLAAQLKVQA